MTNSQIEELFKGHFRSAVFVSQMIVSSKEVAEDIVQEVFIKLLNIELRPGSAPAGLLYAIVRNASIDYLRTRSIHIIESVLSAHIPDNTDDDLSSCEIEYADRLRRLMHAIDQLPQKARDTVKLICLRNYSYADAAQEMGVSVATVKTHMYRSFKSLRRNTSGLIGIIVMAVVIYAISL